MADNQEQRDYWNEKAGPTWVRRRGDLDRLIGPLGDRLLERADPQPGERVLDVGCGSGHTTVEIARRVAPAGSVVGLDIAAVMLEAARSRASDAGVDIELLLVDAQEHDFGEACFDLITSRFGVMFFSDPTAAFANLHRSLKPEGRLFFVCWQPVSANPWVHTPMQAVARTMELPAPPPPGSPGPFAFGDTDRVRGILADAGFTEVSIEPLSQPMVLGANATEALDFMLDIGPVARLLAEASPEGKEKALDALREELGAHATDDGIALDSNAWLVRADG